MTSSSRKADVEIKTEPEAVEPVRSATTNKIRVYPVGTFGALSQPNVSGGQPVMISVKGDNGLQEEGEVVEVMLGGEVEVIAADEDGVILEDGQIVEGLSGQLVQVAAVEEVEQELEGTSEFRSIISAVYPTAFVENFHQSGQYSPEKGRRWKRGAAQVDAPQIATWVEVGGEDEGGEYGRGRKQRRREYSHRLQWCPDAMKVALDAVNSQKMTIRGAAKHYDVPYSTLKDRVNGRVQHGSKPGVKTVLSPEEELELEDCIMRMKESGFQLHCIDIRERARELLIMNRGSNTPYQEVIPGHNWLAGFFKRHKGIEIKRSVSRNCAPSAAKQKQIIRSFFEVAVKMYTLACGSINLPAYRLFVLSDQPISGVSARLLVAASGDGYLLPPYLLLRGARRPSPTLLTSLQEAYPEAGLHVAPTAAVTSESLLAWFRDHFVRYVRSVMGGQRGQGVVLFLSEPISNVSVRLVQLAEMEHIHLVHMAPSIQHLVQPLNDSSLSTLKQDITHQVTSILKAHSISTAGGGSPFLGLIQAVRKVWLNSIPPSEDLRRRFLNNGLLPLNPHAISMDRIMATVVMGEGCTVVRMDDEDCWSDWNDLTNPTGPGSDDEQHGLALLSELSSSEYATFHASDIPDKETQQRKGATTSSRGVKIVNVKPPTGLISVSTCMAQKSENASGEGGCSRTRPGASATPRHEVVKRLRASANSREQIDRAVESIVDSKDIKVESNGYIELTPVPAGNRVSYSAGTGDYVTLTPVSHIIDGVEYVSYMNSNGEMMGTEEVVVEGTGKSGDEVTYVEVQGEGYVIEGEGGSQYVRLTEDGSGLIAEDGTIYGIDEHGNAHIIQAAPGENPATQNIPAGENPDSSSQAGNSERKVLSVGDVKEDNSRGVGGNEAVKPESTGETTAVQGTSNGDETKQEVVLDAETSEIGVNIKDTKLKSSEKIENSESNENGDIAMDTGGSLLDDVDTETTEKPTNTMKQATNTPKPSTKSTRQNSLHSNQNEQTGKDTTGSQKKGTSPQKSVNVGNYTVLVEEGESDGGSSSVGEGVNGGASNSSNSENGVKKGGAISKKIVLIRSSGSAKK